MGTLTEMTVIISTTHLQHPLCHPYTYKLHSLCADITHICIVNLHLYYKKADTFEIPTEHCLCNYNKFLKCRSY